MEGSTQPNASAKRKRRSSILKSQRAPRTPFSELEFNVATPTDTSKSRRVSFSRRTAVAEFATNEATTTWKNVYEEQNKSLESSGHDSVGAGRAPSVGHLGNRVFDQEAIVFEIDLPTFSGAATGPLNQSVNITEHLALLETTADERKLTAPTNHFELSEFTDHGRVFSEDLTNPVNSDMSNIRFNFSTLGQPQNHVTDDLDAVKLDLELESQPNLVCRGPSTRGDVSQYIEFDLNTTQGPIRDSHESDMSITETILSPKRELSNVELPKPVDSWVVNKENIVVNPYVTPDEGRSFAVQESPEKVLVFDGKKLQYAAIDADLDAMKDPIDGPANKSSTNKSLERRKTGLNCLQEIRTQLGSDNASERVVTETEGQSFSGDMSMTGVVDVPQRTEIFDSENGDMSTTKCVTDAGKPDQQVDLVATQALTSILKESDENVSKSSLCQQKVLADMVETEAKSVHNMDAKNRKRQTIVFNENEGDISMTACVPNDVIIKMANKTEASFNMSMTKAIPNNFLESLTRDNPASEEVEMSSDNMSMTKIVPQNLLAYLAADREVPKKEYEIKTEIAEAFAGGEFETSGNMSLTKALPCVVVQNLVMSKYDEIDNNMSMTKPVPNVVVKALAVQEPEVMDVSDINMSFTKAIPNKILNDEMPSAEKEYRADAMDISDMNMSITKAVSNEIISGLASENHIAGKEDNGCEVENRMDSSGTNMSMTKSVPRNLLTDLAAHRLMPEKENEKPKSESFSADMSLTKHLPSGVSLNTTTTERQPGTDDGLGFTNKRRKTIIFDDVDISTTQAISTDFVHDMKQTAASYSSSPSSALSEHVSYPQRNRKTIDILETSNHSKSAATNDGLVVRKSICNENKNVDVSNHTLTTTQVSPSLLRAKSPKSPERPGASSRSLLKSPATSPNKSPTGFSRYVASNRQNSSKSISPDKENKLNADKTTDRMRHTPDSYNHMARYTAARKGRLSAGRGSMNPFSNPNKATSPEEITISPKKQPYQILNKATSPVNKDWNNSVLIYRATSPVKPDQKESATSACTESTPNTTPVDSTTTSNDSLKADKRTSDVQGFSAAKTLNFFNETAEYKVDPTLSEDRRLNGPTSKGDEFHKSSQRLNSSRPAITMLENPQLERRKISPSKAEYKFEEPIKTIAYEQLDSNSRKSIKPLLEISCHQSTEATTPEVVSDTTSFHPSLVESPSKDESLSAIAMTKETSCSPMSRENVAESSDQSVVSMTEDIGLDPPSEQLASFVPTVIGNMLAETGTQKSPSCTSYVESVIATASETKNCSSNESCKTLTDSMEITSDEETLKQSETSTKTLLNNLLDMSELSLPTENGPSCFKTQILPENRNRTICNLPGSPRGNDGFANRTYPHSVKGEIKKKITFCDSPKRRQYIPTDSDTAESNDGRTDRNTTLGNYSEESDSSIATEAPASKLLDIISVLTHPDADMLTSTSSDGTELPRSLKHNFASDTEGTSQVSIIQDGKLVDADSSDTDFATYRKPKDSSSDYCNNKTKVIPSRYYDDVAENVNDLMKDLIKPRSDGYPFEDAPITKKARRSPSICSTTVQATLASSSQVDFESPVDSQSVLSTTQLETYEKPLKGIIKQTISDDVAPPDEYELVTLRLQRHQCESNDDNMLVFDRSNPLNNVMIAPIDFKEAHQYNPADEDNDAVSKRSRSPSLASETEHLCKDVEGRSIVEVKDIEVNTLVAMKGTKELLDANSSLTLVEEPIIRRSTDTDLLHHKKKPTHVLFKGNYAGLEESYLGRLLPQSTQDKSKSPSSPSRSPSKSPTITVPKFKLLLKSDPMDTKAAKKATEEHKSRKKQPITVQQMVAEFCTPGDVKATNKELLLAIQEDMAFSSSGSSIAEGKTSASCDSSEVNLRRSPSPNSEWSPVPANESGSNTPEECDSGVNVVALINMLPFMGGRECTWESSGGDVWSFRLLRGRVRLTVRLAHRLGNAPRRHVRADTPVRDITVKHAYPEKPNTVPWLCVRYATLAMSATAGAGRAGCARAGGTPGVLRRCAGVSRVALRWGAAMNDARARLAFAIQDDVVTLKVANIPLRSVWDVRLRICMSTGAPTGAPAGARLPPWPEATDVLVTPVVTDHLVTPEDVERLLAGIKRDWGHVPKTIWKIFRYLKNKNRDDDILK